VSQIRIVVLTAVFVAATLSIGAFAVVQVADADSREDRSGKRSRATATSSATSQARGGPTESASASASSEPEPEPKPGLVNFTAVAGDRRAADVAAMFDGFFSAINAGDYDRAMEFYDPAGQIDTTDPAERAAFAEGVATSTDSDIVLKAIAESPPDGKVIATVSFTSVQAPDKAPNGQTCTYWTVAYTLSQTDGAYRIFSGDASHDSCY
jgi:hypothetical protein